MSKINEVGNRYGNLVVIEEAGRTKKQTIKWKCLCDCGNYDIINGIKLRNGQRTCCLKCSYKKQAEKVRISNTKDITGQRFGKLIVLNYIGTDPNRGGSLWKCKCDCGNETTANGILLRYGDRTSCGCASTEFLKKYNNQSRDNLVGQKFGKLTVLKYANRTNAHGDGLWICECECGNIVEVQGNNLKSGNSTSCGCKRESNGEQKIRELLIKNNLKFEVQKKFDSCRFVETNQMAKFDFYIENKYLIEYDGEQHFNFKINGGWNNEENFKKTQIRDAFKNQWCKDNNIPLIRIPYTHYDDLCLEDLLPETSKFLIN